MELLAEMRDDSDKEASSLDGEIQRYLLSDSKEETPLSFWKKHEAHFPLLGALARVYMCLSPGSVPVECLFSSTGLLLNGKRSSLAPSRCNMISFIHDNAKFL